MKEIYPYFIMFHVIFSIAFLITAVTISIHSLYGWVKGMQYRSFANKLRKLFISLLYLDLVLGIVLYFFLQKPSDVMNAEQAMRFSSLRFWAIQHFSNMMFVVILGAIGNEFIKRINTDEKKYKYSAMYFGISTVIIVVSVGLFALRK